MDIRYMESEDDIIKEMMNTMGFKDINDSIGYIIDSQRLSKLVENYKNIKERLAKHIARHMKHRLENDRECDIIFLMKHILHKKGYDMKHGKVKGEHIYNIIKIEVDDGKSKVNRVEIEENDMKDLMHLIGYQNLQQAEGKLFNKTTLRNNKAIEEFDKMNMVDRLAKYGIKCRFKAQNKEQELLHFIDKVIMNVGYEVRAISRMKGETDYYIKKLVVIE